MTSDSASHFDDFEKSLASCPVMAVLRGFTPEETVRLAEIAWDEGLENVEVPIESPAALGSLEAAVLAAAQRGKVVGAGTIISVAQLKAAQDLGAAYGVSPGLDSDLVRIAQESNWSFLPGVSTPSEILLAQSLGLTWVKAFPASVLGPEWIKAMKGPFPTLHFVATGGVNGHNAESFLRAGASVVGIGKSLNNQDELAKLREIIQ